MSARNLQWRRKDNEANARPDAITEAAVLRKFPELSLEVHNRFSKYPRLVALLEVAGKRPLSGGQPIAASSEFGKAADTTIGDPETNLHSDIFYHTHKAWLYLTDVTPRDAPLVFVRGSHKLSWPQTREIYRHSIDPKTPSRRITDAELRICGLREERFICERNTLVVANVCGYHRRSQGEPGGERVALHCSVRTQPFFRFIDRFTASMD